MIKQNNKSQIVDISNPSCERVLGTLFKNEDGCIYFRPNPLLGFLAASEWDEIERILVEINRR